MEDRERHLAKQENKNKKQIQKINHFFDIYEQLENNIFKMGKESYIIIDQDMKLYTMTFENIGKRGYFVESQNINTIQPDNKRHIIIDCNER